MRTKSLLTMATTLAIVTSCGSGNKGSIVPIDSLVTDYNTGSPIVMTRDTTPTPDASHPYLLTSQGVANLRLQMPSKEVPDSMPGLYDRVVVTVENDEGEEITLMNFMNGDETAATGEIDDGRLQWLRFTTPAVKLRAGEHWVGTGTPLSALDNIGGMRHYDETEAAQPYHEWRDIMIESLEGDTVTSLFIYTR